MGKATVQIKCTNCGSVSTKRKDNVGATLARGGLLFCSVRCALEYRNGAGTVAERLARQSKQNSQTGCIEWTGYLRGDGYGSLRVDGQQTQAHRAAYEVANGPIPTGFLVCHHCDNRRCINPAHLFLGTNQDNVDDMVAKNRHHGVQQKGSANPMAKLTEKQALYAVHSTAAANEIAEVAGVTPGTIRSIRRGDTWRHLRR